jgi:membrane-bound lytic murein transglycosylase D
VVKAKKGETLAVLARRHGVSAQQIAGWNPGRSLNAKLQAGERVTLMQPVRAKSAVAKASAGKKKPAVRSAAAKKKPVRVAASSSAKAVR